MAPHSLFEDPRNPDNLSPPSTNAGNIPNLKWSFSQSHSKLLNGGWVHKQTVTNLLSSPLVAVVKQCLSAYAYCICTVIGWLSGDLYSTVVKAVGSRYRGAATAGVGSTGTERL
ncbi:uncharacterized protein MEPE_06406 [Melanopsichium pennsylvanicum]|uniref:Uncharacterized protein n=1 Tax=Melanopsichium pennsylvanicum TaxID=63383 RepID=A0AAJ4XTI4_9BASI|nr:uncharacterized protein MEPE_06406 [Melanopsichium pennsylvanicum]